MASPQRTCAFSGCVRTARYVGLCNGHYQQRQRGVELHPIKRYRTDAEVRADDVARFHQAYEVDPVTGCWEWQLATTYGYGYFRASRKHVRAHRFAYEIHKGDIPDGLTIDHLCRNRGCVNPDHLEAVTQMVNSYRAPNVLSTINAGKVACPAGHRYTPETTRIEKAGKNGRTRRKCRICDRDRHRVAREASRGDRP